MGVYKDIGFMADLSPLGEKVIGWLHQERSWGAVLEKYPECDFLAAALATNAIGEFPFYIHSSYEGPGSSHDEGTWDVQCCYKCRVDNTGVVSFLRAVLPHLIQKKVEVQVECDCVDTEIFWVEPAKT